MTTVKFIDTPAGLQPELTEAGAIRLRADPFTDATKAGSIFRDHSCYRCDSGNKPCIKGKGHERECDTLHARND